MPSSALFGLYTGKFRLESSRYTRDYDRLRRADIYSLTDLLSQAPTPSQCRNSTIQEDYAKAVQDRIALLPEHVKSPWPNFVRTLVRKHASEARRSRAGILCDLHIDLGQELMESILSSLIREMQEGIEKILKSFSKVDIMMTNQANRYFLAPLRWLGHAAAMWMTDEEFQATYPGCQPLPIFQEQHDGCAACILARMGGRGEILVPLRVALLMSMTDRQAKRSRRLHWVDSWIRQLDDFEPFPGLQTRADVFYWAGESGKGKSKSLMEQCDDLHWWTEEKARIANEVIINGRAEKGISGAHVMAMLMRDSYNEDYRRLKEAMQEKINEPKRGADCVFLGSTSTVWPVANTSEPRNQRQQIDVVNDNNRQRSSTLVYSAPGNSVEGYSHRDNIADLATSCPSESTVFLDHDVEMKSVTVHGRSLQSSAAIPTIVSAMTRESCIPLPLQSSQSSNNEEYVPARSKWPKPSYPRARSSPSLGRGSNGKTSKSGTTTLVDLDPTSGYGYKASPVLQSLGKHPLSIAAQDSTYSLSSIVSSLSNYDGTPSQLLGSPVSPIGPKDSYWPYRDPDDFRASASVKRRRDREDPLRGAEDRAQSYVNILGNHHDSSAAFSKYGNATNVQPNETFHLPASSGRHVSEEDGTGMVGVMDRFLDALRYPKDPKADRT